MIKPKEFENISQEYIESLIDNGIEESIHLDYKEKIGSNSEIAKDLSSFANSNGGNIIYGIQEEKNKPKNIKIIEGRGIREKLDQIARYGIDPPLDIRVKATDVSIKDKKGQIFLVYIPKKYPNLHYAKKKKRYYKRTEFTSSPMEDFEIKEAFGLAYKSKKKIDKFRDGRLHVIRENNFIVDLLDNSKVVIHMIPKYSIILSQDYDMELVKNHYKRYLRPMNCDYPTPNLWEEGLLISCKNEDNKTSSYVNIFNNGIIESVECRLIQSKTNRKQAENVLYIKRLEETIIKAVERYLIVQDELKASLPIYIYISLLNVKNFYIPLNRHYGVIQEKSQRIKNDNLFLPRIKIKYYEQNIANILKPAFDYIWRACGEFKNLDYNEEGEFKF